MLVTRATQYALQAVLTLAREPVRLYSARRLARETGTPARFLSKILSGLSRARLLISSPGVHGGFRLARPANRISVWDVVSAVEETPILDPSLATSHDEEDSGGEALHGVWVAAQAAMERELSRVTFDEKLALCVL